MIARTFFGLLRFYDSGQMKMDYFWISTLGTLFTFGVTALGAAVVLLFRNIGERVMDAMLGFGGGVMIASSFFSLILPAIEGAKNNGQPVWLPVAFGFLLGVLLIFLGDLFLKQKCAARCETPAKRRIALLIFAITLHNIPEGLAVGVAFGAAQNEGGALAAAMLALGIGLQNFPEGAAVSLPLFRDGMKKGKAFALGALSGVAEPLAGCVGFFAARLMQGILPYILCLAAGCMMAVAFCEVIPECTARHKNIGLWGLSAGFVLMMLLDVLL